MARWCEEVTNSVKVDLDTSNICSSDRNHAEEPVFPPSEQSDSLVQHEKVMQPLGNIGRHREEFTWGYRSGCVPHCVVIFNKRTDEMSTLFDNPSGGTMEPVVVTRGKVDNTEEEGVPGFDASSGGTSSTFYSCACPHLSCNLDGFEQTLGEVLRVYYRRIGRLAKAVGRAMSVLRGVIGAGGHISGSSRTRVGGTNQLGQTVLDPVDLCKLAVVYNFVISIDKGNPCAGSGFGSLDAEECVQGVGDSLDLFDSEVLDGTKVKHGPVGGTDLEESKGDQSWNGSNYGKNDRKSQTTSTVTWRDGEFNRSRDKIGREECRKHEKKTE